MDWFSAENVVAMVTSAVGVLATLYALWREQRPSSNKRRIGWRVQMDTPIGSAPDGQGEAARRLFTNIPGDATLVLVRIESDGAKNITPHDYSSPDGRPGLKATFTHRAIQAVAATMPSELSFLGEYLTPRDLRHEGNELYIPKVPLNHRQHFKLLVLLDGGPVDSPIRVTGGIHDGSVVETKAISVDAKPPMFSRTAQILVGGLAAFLIALASIILFSDGTPPAMGCARGTLKVIGSTAFEPVIEKVAAKYERDCPGSEITVEAHGSAAGVRELQDTGKAQKGTPSVIALSDGRAPADGGELVENRIAVSVFTLVLNDSVPLRDLRLADIRKIYAGQVTHWDQLDKKLPHLPVVLVSRGSSSGTRATLQQRVLGGAYEINDSSTDCVHKNNNSVPVIRCELDTTQQLLETVGEIPGAIGYSELGDAQHVKHVRPIGIDGNQPSLKSVGPGKYPFDEIEYAYTYGQPSDDSLVFSFLQYARHGGGQDIIRNNGHLPCEAADGVKVCSEL